MGTLDPVVQDALNKQITNERQNSAIYAAMANKFDVLNLVGMAAFARAQSAEEQTHAQKFTDYVIDRYGVPVVDALLPVTAPECDISSAAYIMFTGALQREQLTTEQIKTLYDLAEDADDPQTCQFLLWFLEEQTKSEREFSELVARAQFAQGCAAAVLALDEKLGG